jgi:hypothetical protein
MQLAPRSRENARETASFRPRSFNRRTQARFIAARTAFWLSCCGGEPTARQSTLVESIAQLEWGAEVARHENTLVALRDLREHLRLRDRLVGDLERTIRDAAIAAEPDPVAALNAHLANIAARRAELTAHVGGAQSFTHRVD